MTPSNLLVLWNSLRSSGTPGENIAVASELEGSSFLVPAVGNSSRCWAGLGLLVAKGMEVDHNSPDEEDSADEAHVHPDLGPRPVGGILGVLI